MTLQSNQRNNSPQRPGRWFASAGCWLVAPEQNYLRWGIALSLCVHAAFLVLRVPASTEPVERPPAMDVVLVNALTEQAPLAPKVIAQDNLEGGGQIEQEAMASNPLPRVGKEAEDVSLIALTRQRQQLELQQDQLLKQLLSSWQAKPNQSRSEDKEETPANGQDETDQQALEQNARIAAILNQIERYNQRPRKYFDAPSTIANPFASYVDAWRVRIEDIGSQHYPPGEGNRPSGQLQASVTIAASGAVLDVTIDRPSSDPRINQAVRRIIELAQPFPAFPAHLAREADELVITRTWTFTPGSFKTEANQ